MSTISQHTAAVEAFHKVVPHDPVIYLASVGDMSIYHHDAKVLPVPRPLALKYLAKKTHRLATEEEIQTYDKQAEAARVESENARQLPISAATIAQVAVAVAHQQKQHHEHGSDTKPVEPKKGRGE